MTPGLTLRQRLWAHDAWFFGTLADCTTHPGWYAYREPTLPSRYDPNHAGYVRLQPAAVAGFIASVIAEADARRDDAVVYLDTDATPHDLGQTLVAAGFVPMHAWGPIDLMLCGPVTRQDSAGLVTPVRDAAAAHAWAMLAEADAFSPADIMYRLRRREISDPRVTAWLISIDGQPAGRCLSAVHDGLGRVESVFVDPAHRRRGLATALVSTVAAHIVGSGAQPYLFATQNGDAQRIYRRIGFSVSIPAAVVTYVRAYTAS